MKRIMALAFAVALLSSVVYAHVTVAPTVSLVGTTQTYELRVHNEKAIATTSLDLEVPDGITVLDVAKPESGSVATVKKDDRVSTITWTTEVPSGKYLAFKFTAKNPATAKEVKWSIREHMADGSVIVWSDSPGAQEKGSVTTIRTETP